MCFIAWACVVSERHAARKPPFSSSAKTPDLGELIYQNNVRQVPLISGLLWGHILFFKKSNLIFSSEKKQYLKGSSFCSCLENCVNVLWLGKKNKTDLIFKLVFLNFIYFALISFLLYSRHHSNWFLRPNSFLGVHIQLGFPSDKREFFFFQHFFWPKVSEFELQRSRSYSIFIKIQGPI